MNSPPTTNDLPADSLANEGELAWQTEGLRFNAFGRALRRRFGGRVQRVSIDAGFTCPNVDGAVTQGGCNFCDNRSFSPSRRVRLKRVSEQLIAGIQTVTKRYDRVDGFIAYFQPATNTYAPVEQLDEIFRLALNADPRVVGLAIGTRPDCVPESVLSLLEDLARHYVVSLEYGMQSVHDDSLQWMNRAHTHADMINAIDRSRGRGFECTAHVILGVPGETHEMMMQTAEEIGVLGFDAIKLHNLYSVKGTPLGDEVLAGKIKMMDRDEYICTVVDFLERIPPATVVERVSGEAPPQYLIEPKWCLEKSAIRNEIGAEFRRRGTRQGDRFIPPALAPEDREVPPDLTPQTIRDQIESRGRLPVLKMQPPESTPDSTMTSDGDAGGLHSD
ncbi:TIGR01212 family radical SAM protein [Neorhodopirellula pilleata]|uniref:Oxygen-independent coproporphyrinogen-III oxidase 1 n=1 Tax=Neorhodopirellula pilleata TaxID=2714738 RepID=A0A5C5ZNV3_9BACT|nr:TIGR01212 family radical SAM protein [Neorhodopirellula pilleata]TWT89182.1 Oxygen-independent coproporphyrinogen-III oxidase 1 [Neorhodopirellula pilleata]